MITETNFRDLLLHLGFEEKDCIFEKHFPKSDAVLKADFHNKELIYPEARGLVVNERQTCNFSTPENFVVMANVL